MREKYFYQSCNISFSYYLCISLPCQALKTQALYLQQAEAGCGLQNKTQCFGQKKYSNNNYCYF